MELAPAKINLALHVTGRRDDGYHLIESLVVFTRYGDRLTFEAAQTDAIEITGPFSEMLPADETNLVARARDTLREAFGTALCPPVAIRLEKNLPVASGIGGGSSDAAAALRGLSEFWSLDAGKEALLTIGASLGADVPMCIEATPLIAQGIGEQLSPVSSLPNLAIVLVNPGVGIATPSVFSALVDRSNAPLPALPSDLGYDALIAFLRTTRNDLEAAAETIEPSAKAVKAALKQAGADFVRMSGSGATCFGIFPTGNLAKRAAVSIRRNQPDWFVAATRSMPSEDMREQD